MISEGDDFVRIQYEDSQGRTIIDKVEGDAVYPEIDAITIPDYFFILNKSRIYRFYGFGEEGTSGGGRPVFSDQIMNQIMKLPGFTSGDAQGFPLRVSPSIEYLLLFDEDGGYQLIRKL